MSRYKVSVIIATYNTVDYIEECLDSIFSQILDSIEVIVIDDGSTDNTNEVLSCYKGKYDNLVTHYQENSGAGNARNYGISIARGEYICFMDPDDTYPNNDCLKMLYETARKNNVKICGGNIAERRGKYISKRYVAGDGDVLVSKNKIIKVDNYFYMYGHTRFLYETNFIRQNHICFASYKRFEDQVFTVKALGIAKEFFELDYCVYLYRRQHRKVDMNIDVYLDVFKGFRDTLQLICNYDLKLMFEKNYSDFVESYMSQISQYTFNGNEEFDKVIGDINHIVKHSDWFKEEYLITYERIKNYRNEVEELKRSIVEILNSGKPIIMYGAGLNSEKFITRYTDLLQSVIGIDVSDNVKNNSELEGFSVRQISNYSCFKNDAIVLVTPLAKTSGEILDNLMKLGFKNCKWIDVNGICND